jgi:apolipoprotein N-acyltransferase
VTKHKDDVFLSSRLVLATLAGAASYFAYPRPGLWPVIFLSVAGLLIAARGATISRAALIGFFGGFAFYASQGWWLSQYLGPVPLIALSFTQALFVGGGMMIFAYARRYVSSAFAAATLFASVWTAREWASTNFPYGGYPWSRLAMSQADSPLAGWVYFGGFSLLTFVVAFAAAYIVEWWPGFWSQRTETKFNREAKPTRTSLLTLIAVVLPVFLVPQFATPTVGAEKLKVAAIQGNANAGLFAQTRRGEIFDNHLDATYQMLDSQDSGDLDLIVWPENASDLNPITNEDARAKLSRLVNEDANVSIAFGTITANGAEIYNSSFLWEPGKGITDQYDKKRPVPFAEYVPDRDFWYALAPDLVGLISRGYAFGERDSIFVLDGQRLGVLICFEVAIDSIFYDLVDQGATAILSQTNNADFGRSDQAWQQLAIAKLRSIETGLALVNASTVGPSAIYDRGGETLGQTGAFVAGHLVSEISLAPSQTPAMSFGRYLDFANASALAISIIWLTVRGSRKKAKQNQNVF